MKTLLSLSLTIMVMLSLAVTAWGQIPKTISYQGVLTDVNGGPANGSREMAFRLYGSETGGTFLWEEQRTIDVNEGLFHVLLGSVTALDLSFDAPYWLEVAVNGVTLATRTPLASAPYSLNAVSIKEGVAVTSLNGITDDMRLVEGAGVRLDVNEGAKTITINAVDESDFSLPYEDSVAALGKYAFKVRNTVTGGGIAAEAKRGAAMEAIGFQGISVRAGNPAKVDMGGEGIGVDVIGAGGHAFRVGYAELSGLSVKKAGTGVYVEESLMGVEVFKATTGVKLDTVDAGIRVISAKKEGVHVINAASGLLVNKAIMGVKLDAVDVGVVVESAKKEGVQILNAATGLMVDKGTVGIKLNAVDVGMAVVSAKKEGIRVGRAVNGVMVERADTIAFWAGDSEIGLLVGNARLEGVNVQNAASSGFGVERSGGPGLKVIDSRTGVHVWKAREDGIQIDTAVRHGLRVYDAFEDGVHIDRADGAGVYVDNADGDGLFVNNSWMSGLRVVAADEDGVHVGIAGRHGLIVDSAAVDGLHVVGAGEYGVFASGRLGAGYFNGNVTVTGSLSKGSGTFKIDHPQDPLNKYLYHSFVESPDMMNVYNGNALLDANGETWVELPSYFESLNREFRYQLTPLGGPGPNLYVAEEISENRFRIAGGAPGMKVSWQVTGVRKDPYAEVNRVQVEVDKPEGERGTYLHPDAYRTSGVAESEQHGKR